MHTQPKVFLQGGVGWLGGLGALSVEDRAALQPFITQRAQDALTGKNDAPPAWAYPLGLKWMVINGYKVPNPPKPDFSDFGFNADSFAEIQRYAADHGMKLGKGQSEAPVVMRAARDALDAFAIKTVATEYEKNAGNDVVSLTTTGKSSMTAAGSSSSGLLNTLTSPWVLGGAAVALGGALFFIRRRRMQRQQRPMGDLPSPYSKRKKRRSKKKR